MSTQVLPFRGVHYDLARGNYDSLPSLRRLVRFMADCGLNELVLYMEDLWQYRRHPSLSNPHAYEPAEIGELARYAAERGVDLIPSLTTLGHAHHILGKPGYEALAFPGRGADFDVTNPRVYELFGELFDEVLPHFDSPYVFLNGDEVNLSRLSDAAREQARREGLGALFGQGMGRLATMVIDRGRRPIIWHDMLLHHPEAMDLLPRETIVTYWYYDYQPDYPAIDFFCERGFDVLAGPAVLRHESMPDYARAMPNILSQTRVAVQSRGAGSSEQASRGTSLGTLLTIWERVDWAQSALGIYAAGRWAHEPDTPTEEMLDAFARDVFGLDQPGLGEAWVDGSRDLGRLVLQRAGCGAGRSGAEREALAKPLAETRQRLRGFLVDAERGQPQRNADIHQHMADTARRMAGYSGDVTARTDPAPLLSPDLVGAGERACRVVSGRTPWDHELVVLTNGSIAAAILPGFGAAMIEWVLLGDDPWSVVMSGYAAWAEAEHPRVGDPALGSAWGAGRVGGWRECIYYNARLNPSSLWGRPFEIETVHESSERVTVECRGENEVARLVRTVSVVRDADRIEIESVATNKLGTGVLGIQPNVPHVMPGTCCALLRLVEWCGDERTSRALIEHDGTMLFTPAGGRVRIESPLSGHYLQVRFDPDQVPLILTDTGADMFTFEPYSAQRRCATGESVGLRLEYELGG